MFVEKDHIYDFLTSLNIEFNDVRVHILGKEDLPSLNETIAMIHVEEGRRSVMLETQVVDSFALVTKSTVAKELQHLQFAE